MTAIVWCLLAQLLPATASSWLTIPLVQFVAFVPHSSVMLWCSTLPLQKITLLGSLYPGSTARTADVIKLSSFYAHVAYYQSGQYVAKYATTLYWSLAPHNTYSTT